MTEAELDRLIAAYGGMVKTICRGILSPAPQDAEEAAADTFVKLWRSKKLPSEEAVLRGYILRTARSCAIDHYRSLARKGTTLPLDEWEDAAFSVALESKLETRELIETVRALSPPEGELFLRRYLYGEPASLLAGQYHMPEATVRTKLHRAKKKLQALLGMEVLK